MNLYEFVSVILVPYILITFSIEYLSNTLIEKDELKIGIWGMLHHLAEKSGFLTLPIAAVLCNDMRYFMFAVFSNMLAQIGFLLNDDKCWMTRNSNILANPAFPNKKFLSTFDSFIKQYIRGDEWANGSFHPKQKYTTTVTIFNIIIIIKFIVVIIKNK